MNNTIVNIGVAAVTLLSVACAEGPSELSEASLVGSIDSWEATSDGDVPVLRALDQNGGTLAQLELVAPLSGSGLDEDSVVLRFSLPESGDVMVSRAGLIEGDVSQQLLDLAAAARAEFPTTEPNEAGAGPLDPESAGEVEKTTNNGSFRIEGGLIGASGRRTVGSLCPPGERRRAFRVSEVDEPLFGGSCDGNGFLNSNDADCRIVVQYSAALASAVRCVWEVTSR